MLWQCFRPTTSTKAKVRAAAQLALLEMDGPSCGGLLEGTAHSRSLGYARNDKSKGGGAPWHGWRWMDRVEKELLPAHPPVHERLGAASAT